MIYNYFQDSNNRENNISTREDIEEKSIKPKKTSFVSEYLIIGLAFLAGLLFLLGVGYVFQAVKSSFRREWFLLFTPASMYKNSSEFFDLLFQKILILSLRSSFIAEDFVKY